MNGECTDPIHAEKRRRAAAEPSAGGPALQCFQMPSLATARGGDQCKVQRVAGSQLAGGLVLRRDGDRVRHWATACHHYS